MQALKMMVSNTKASYSSHWIVGAVKISLHVSTYLINESKDEHLNLIF